MSLAKDDIKLTFELLIQNSATPMSQWVTTRIEYELLVGDFEERQDRFPNKKKFIKMEKNRIGNDVPFQNADYVQGYKTFERGEDPSFSSFYFDLMDKYNSDEIDTDEKLSYFFEMSKGFAAAKFYYYLESLVKEDSSSKIEAFPEFEYKTEVQKIAWLYELGILDAVLSRSKSKGVYNWARAANVISSFTNMKPDTIRKSLQAIYQQNESNKKNNPLNSADNRLFISDMTKKFNLDKD